jgi:hypothetical protein
MKEELWLAQTIYVGHPYLLIKVILGGIFPKKWDNGYEFSMDLVLRKHC